MFERDFILIAIVFVGIRLICLYVVIIIFMFLLLSNGIIQIPLSVTTVLRDMEIYNTLDPESNLYNPRTGMTAANPLLDNNVKDPSRYNNGRLFKSWLQVSL